MNDPRLRYREESQGERIARKSKETPFFPIGKLLYKISMYIKFCSEYLFVFCVSPT